MTISALMLLMGSIATYVAKLRMAVYFMLMNRPSFFSFFFWVFFFFFPFPHTEHQRRKEAHKRERGSSYINAKCNLPGKLGRRAAPPSLPPSPPFFPSPNNNISINRSFVFEHERHLHPISINVWSMSYEPFEHLSNVILCWGCAAAFNARGIAAL